MKSPEQERPLSTKTSPELEEEAQSIIKRHAMLATGAGMIPIPGLDVAGVAGAKIHMIKSLAELYGIDFAEQEVKPIVTSIISTLSARLLPMLLDALTPFDKDGVSGFTTALARGAMSGLFTAELGQVYKLHFEAGGTIDSMSPSTFIDYVSEQVQSGNVNPTTFLSPTKRFSYLWR